MLYTHTQNHIHFLICDHTDMALEWRKIAFSTGAAAHLSDQCGMKFGRVANETMRKIDYRDAEITINLFMYYIRLNLFKIVVLYNEPLFLLYGNYTI